MTFRESINYRKDLITGNKLEVKKRKLITPVTGIFKVEMFDDLTGKKTYEAKSENRITAALSSLAYMSTIYNGLLEGFQREYIKETFCEYSNSNAPNSTMVLTDNVDEESPFDRFIKGNVIGYADLWNSYSGNNKYRGTINKAETSRYKDTKHFVVDFPTNAANGTFSSIYTCGASSSSTPTKPLLNNIFYDYKFASSKDGWNFQEVSVFVDEKCVYALNIYAKEIGVFGKENYKRIKVIPNDKKFKRILYDRMGNYWGLEMDTKNIHKLSKEDFSIEKTIEIPKEAYYSYSNEFCDMCVNEGYFYILSRGKNGYYDDNHTMIAQIGKDGLYVSKKDLGEQEYGIALLDTGDELLIYSNNYYIYFMDKDLNIKFKQDAEWSRFGSSWRFAYDWKEKVVYSSEYHGNGGEHFLKRGYFIPAVSHTLLPEPVTKTPTKTMKIQYDITVDRVGVFEMPKY